MFLMIGFEVCQREGVAICGIEAEAVNVYAVFDVFRSLRRCPRTQ